jgi:hypothetical protein
MADDIATTDTIATAAAVGITITADIATTDTIVTHAEMTDIGGRPTPASFWLEYYYHKALLKIHR